MKSSSRTNVEVTLNVWQLINLLKIIDMAIGRTEFVNRVQSKINEIVQNLALIMYSGSSDMVKSHWKLDLTANLIDLAVNNLRCRNS